MSEAPVDRVLELVRDPNAALNSRAFVRSILTHAQWAINTRRGASENVTVLTTIPSIQIYPVMDEIPLGIKIKAVRVRDGGSSVSDERDLERVTLKSLTHVDLNWFGKIGPRIEVFATVGRDLLILHPGLSVASTVQVISSNKTPEFLTDSTEITLSDEDALPMIDLTQIILLARARMTGTLKNKIEELSKRMRKLTE
ncbi:hypothetical protein IIA15_07910 [candidate division TA06 bacterium]|nr:hypothetical protein [candidate division TA06 bacterium]